MIAQSLPALIAPELTLTFGAVAVLLIGVSKSRSIRSATGVLAFLSILTALAMAWYNPPQASSVSAPGLRLTTLTHFVRLIALSIGLLVLLVNWHLPRDTDRGDLFAMILFSLTGVLLTALADDMVVLFLAIELVSVPTYILVSVGRSDIRAQEAGVKYFFLGALSAALLVYGFSFLYGAAGTTALTGVHFATQGAYLTIGLVLAFAGVAFKIAAVPFHVYAADVYQGSAAPVTGLLGFFPKLAGFVALIKLLMIAQPVGPAAVGWVMPSGAFYFLWIVSAATMTIGNTLGLMQTNVKRMLGYSSIAHSGYMLVAILVGPVPGGGPLPDGVSAMLFYIVAYGVMNLGVFALVAVLTVHGREAEDLDDLAGLSRAPGGGSMAALAMAICAFSLMGMPPTAGFFGKLYIFTGALSAGPQHAHRHALMVLAVVGVINSAIAAAYYLRLVSACYLRDERGEVTVTPRSGGLRAGLLCCCIVILLIGVWPQGLIRMARQSSIDLHAPDALVSRPPAPDEITSQQPQPPAPTGL